MKPMRLKFLLCALLLGLLATAVRPTTAAPTRQTSPSIRMDVTVGFDNLRKDGLATPVQLTLANDGPALEGQVHVSNGGFGDTGTLYQASISLPTQSNKRIFLSAYLSNTPLTVQIVDDNGEVVLQRVINNTRVLPENSLLYGAITPNPDALENLDKVLAGRADAAVAFLQIADLPNESVGWRMLDVLVFNDVDTNELSAAQRQALLEWVDLGGQLVVTGGANWQKTTSAVADLLPVQPTGLQSVADLPALAEAVGKPFRDAGPYTVTTSSLRDGELLYRQESLPLLARRPQGLGNVFFLALDPQFAPLDDWDGREILWQSVADYIPRPIVWNQPFRDESLASNAVEIFPDLTLPSAATIFCFMLLYVLAIGPLNYWVLQRLNKRELAWVTIPLGVLFFSVVAYVMGVATLGNRAMLNQMSMVYGPMGGRAGSAQTAVALYSPSRTSYTLQLPLDAQVRTLNSYFSGRRTVVERDTAILVQSNLADVGEVLDFLVTSNTSLPNLAGQVTTRELEDGRLQLDITFTNNSDLTFENAILLINRGSITLGTVTPGQAINQSFIVTRGLTAQSVKQQQRGFHQYEAAVSASSGAPLESVYSDLLGAAGSYGYYYYSDDPLRYGRYQFLEALRDSYSTSSTGNFPRGPVTFIGWVSDPLLDVELINTASSAQGTTLYFLEIPYQP